MDVVVEQNSDGPATVANVKSESLLKQKPGWKLKNQPLTPKEVQRKRNQATKDKSRIQQGLDLAPGVTITVVTSKFTGKKQNEYNKPRSKKPELNLINSTDDNQDQLSCKLRSNDIHEEMRRKFITSYKKSQRVEETPERRESRLLKQQERQRKIRMNETPDQKAARIAKELERHRRTLDNESPEERAIRIAKQIERNKIKYLNETPEEKRIRLAKQIERSRRRRKNETPEEKAIRLAKQLERTRRRRRDKNVEVKDADVEVNVNSDPGRMGLLQKPTFKVNKSHDISGFTLSSELKSDAVGITIMHSCFS